MHYIERMRKIDFINLIEETTVELVAAEKNQSNARIRLRARFVRLLKSGQVAQLKQVTAIVGITPKHASALWKKYRQVGLASYLTLDHHAGVSRLSVTEQAELLKKAESGFRSQREAIEYLREEFNCNYTQQGVSVLFERLKIKAKTARPANVKADVAEQGEYKKRVYGIRSNLERISL